MRERDFGSLGLGRRTPFPKCFSHLQELLFKRPCEGENFAPQGVFHPNNTLDATTQSPINKESKIEGAETA